MGWRLSSNDGKYRIESIGNGRDGELAVVLTVHDDDRNVTDGIVLCRRGRLALPVVPENGDEDLTDQLGRVIGAVRSAQVDFSVGEFNPDDTEALQSLVASARDAIDDLASCDQSEYAIVLTVEDGDVQGGRVLIRNTHHVDGSQRPPERSLRWYMEAAALKAYYKQIALGWVGFREDPKVAAFDEFPEALASLQSAAAEKLASDDERNAPFKAWLESFARIELSSHDEDDAPADATSENEQIDDIATVAVVELETTLEIPTLQETGS